MNRIFYTSPIASSFQGIGIAVILLVSTMFLPHLVLAGEQDQIRWDNKYATEKYLFGRKAIPFLRDHIDLLPKGPVLDLAILAMGEGRNGVFLAAQGYQVTGVDISEEGLKKAQALAAERGVTLKTVVADLDTYDIPPNTFDVIICTYYLQRDLFPKIVSALKPGGVVGITYNTGQRSTEPSC